MIHLRQICLVAEQLQPVVADLQAVLAIKPCYVDPGVERFGLHNTLLAVGCNFIEVVAPIRQATAAGRYLERRRGDGGYMVITQADSRDEQRAMRQRALDVGVRIAFESEQEHWGLCQLHPADMQAAFLEVEWDKANDPQGNWHPAGGTGWQSSVCRDRCNELIGVELQSQDPLALAEKWAGIINAPVERVGATINVPLANAVLQFVELQDERGPGLSAVQLSTTDASAIDATLAAADARGLVNAAGALSIGGTRFDLRAS